MYSFLDNLRLGSAIYDIGIGAAHEIFEDQEAFDAYDLSGYRVSFYASCGNHEYNCIVVISLDGVSAHIFYRKLDIGDIHEEVEVASLQRLFLDNYDRYDSGYGDEVEDARGPLFTIYPNPVYPPVRELVVMIDINAEDYKQLMMNNQPYRQYAGELYPLRSNEVPPSREEVLERFEVFYRECRLFMTMMITPMKSSRNRR